MNKDEKAFLKYLLKSIEQAKKTQDSIWNDFFYPAIYRDAKSL